MKGLLMNIYTTYFSNIRNLPENIVPVSITAKPPKKWEGIEYKKLAPKYDILFEWKRTHDDAQYSERYCNEILNHLDPKKVIDDLSKISTYNDGKDVALVCYETPRCFCHRHIVSRWLNQNGCCVKEYVDMRSIK